MGRLVSPRGIGDGITSSLVSPRRGGGGAIDAFTVALLHMDGANNGTTFTDELGTIWTPHVNTKTSTSDHKFGGSSMVNDASSWLSGPLTVTFGSGDFTVDFWMNLTSAATERRLFSQYIDGSNFMYVYINSNQTIQFSYKYGDVYLASYLFNTANLVGNWRHMAFVRSGNNFNLYQDGVVQTATVTTDISGKSLSFINSQWAIGSGRPASAFNPFVGYIDEFRVSNGIARWTADFTPPIVPYS